MSQDSSARPRMASLTPKWSKKKKKKWATLIISIAVLLVLFIILLPLGLLGYLTGRRQPKTGRVKVDLGYATYEGTRLPNSINRFLGIRYAKAPLGDLRWRAPVEPDHTDKVQNATHFQSICLSSDDQDWGWPAAEDCLFANVWAPTNATEDSKLPVWLWIQGGGYTANSNANYDGAEVVERSGNNIILVNFNYRVSLFGFLTSERVRQDGDLNVGLLDQRLMLHWVQKHIKKFGGDPNHVVIDGGSAGAGSVVLHQVAYGGRDDGLFAGAIAESVFFPQQPRVNELEWQFEHILSATGCNSTTDNSTSSSSSSSSAMACLRSKSTQDLQKINKSGPLHGAVAPTPLPKFYWTVCIDGDFLTDLPYALIERGAFVRVPMLFGVCTNEGTYFAPNARSQNQVATFFRNNFPFLRDNDTDAIIRHYPREPAVPRHAPFFPSASRAYGDAVFVCPAVNFFNAVASGLHSDNSSSSSSRRNYLTGTTAQQQQRSFSQASQEHNNTTNSTNFNSSSATASSPPKLWHYRFAVLDDTNVAQGLGTPHLMEAAAVFGPGNVLNPPASLETYNAAIVPIVMDYWLSFVRKLDPNVLRNSDAPRWAGWTSSADDDDDDHDDDEDGVESVEEEWSSQGIGRQLVLQTGNVTMESIGSALVDRCRFWLELGSTAMRQ